MALDLRQNFVYAQYLENKLTELNEMYSFWPNLILIVNIIFRTFMPELLPFVYDKNLFPLNILRTKRQNFSKFYLCIHIDNIYDGIVTHHFLHLWTRVMALDLRQNFVYPQYLEKKLTEFHQIWYMHSYWQDLRWDCYTSFLADFPELLHLVYARISLPRNILRTNGHILTKPYVTIYT